METTESDLLIAFARAASKAQEIKVTDTIRRDGKIEWHSVGELQRDLDSGGGQLTIGKIVLAIVLAFLILGFLGMCSTVVFR